MSFEPLRKPQTRSQLVVSQIEDQIRAGELTHGEKLASETQLAHQFGVSRSVVREALRLLEAMGLISSRHGSGSYVSNNTERIVSRILSLSVMPDETSVHELFEFRESLESDAARLAAQRRSEGDVDTILRRLEANASAAAARDAEEFTRTDWEFHAAISEAAGNRYLAVVLKAVREMQYDVVNLLTTDTGSVDQAVDQHRRIVKAVIEGSAEGAESAARIHIQTTAACCIERAIASMQD
ncbi:FadR/GntR family transcriptional regulator [Phytoactinopolyspora endophytica]|uniref:FadR/GntR family transcriptional regulator n=1 Tax=Phytoactinopolyspora endophytica TaxID=1642495 RepID=UPI0013ED77F9|nr:FadR/GntR family transcriptional regulator [Phytoactinopolyspora endophytica]